MKFSFPRNLLRFKGGGKKKEEGRSRSALDIGGRSVKWLELRGTEKPEVVTYASVPLQKGAGRENLVAAIRKVVQLSGSNSHRIHSAIGGQSVIIRYVQLPKMTREELRSSIEFEADKYIPFNVKDVVLDCQILEEKEESGKILAVLVAAKKDAVSHYVSLLHDAGLELELLDVDTFALANAFEYFLGHQTPAKIHALFDLGAKTTNVNILRGTTSLFSRGIPIGGDHFTEALSEKLGLETDPAEVLKCSGTKSKEELLELIAAPLETLMGEVRLSFDYFENQYDRKIERIYLSGGSSLLSGIPEHFQNTFNVESLLWNPLQKITVPPKEELSKLAKEGEGLGVGVGLALRRPE